MEENICVYIKEFQFVNSIKLIELINDNKNNKLKLILSTNITIAFDSNDLKLSIKNNILSTIIFSSEIKYKKNIFTKKHIAKYINVKYSINNNSFEKKINLK